VLTIKEVRLQGWKGIDLMVFPGKNTLLCGPNGSGKSAVLEAVRYAIEGRTSVGATPAAVATFAAPEGCKVTVSLSDGFAWTRGLSINHHTGAMSQYLEIHGQGGLNLKEAHAMVAAHCGDFAPMFDLGQGFLDLSDDKRRSFVLDLCAQASKHEGSAAEISTRAIKGYLKQPEDQDIDFGEVGPSEAYALGELHGTMLRELKGNLPEMVGQAINICREAANFSKRDKDRANAACDKIAERRASVTPIAETKADLDARLAEVRASILAAEKALSNHAGRSTARKSLADQLARAKAQVENARGQLVAVETDDVALEAAIWARAGELAVQIDLRSEVPNKLSAAMGANQKWSNELLRLSHEKELLEDRLSGDWVKLDEHAETFESYNFTGPLVGGNANAEWNAIRLIIRRNTASLPADRQRAADLVREMDTARAERLAAIETEKELQASMAKLQTLRIEHREAMVQLNDLERKAGRAAQGHMQIDTWSKAVAELEGKLSAFDDSAGPDVDALRLRLSQLEAETRIIERSLNAVAEQSALESEHTKLIQDAELSAVKWRVAQELGESCKSLRAELMEELTRPLLEPMTACLRLFDEGSRAYCRLENEKGTPIIEIGWQRGERKTAYEALSAGEKCIVGAALARALIELANPPLKLLMLEAGEVDEKAIDTLLTAIAGSDAQVLLATWFMVETCSPAWTFISMAPSAAMQEAVA